MVPSPRIELGLPESEPDVITNYTMRDLLVSVTSSKYKIIIISEASGRHLCFDFSKTKPNHAPTNAKILIEGFYLWQNKCVADDYRRNVIHGDMEHSV